MDFNLREGISAVAEITVTDRDTAIFYGSGDLPVFATPAMIALMESTAKSSVGLHLNSELTTVGIKVDVDHIRATPKDMRVKCEAVLDKIEGKKLFFKVTAWDERNKIGEGIHIRYIVDSIDFMKKFK